MNAPPILGLSNELLRLILDQIEPEPDKIIPIDRRQFLSVESFDRPQSSTRGSLKDVGSFRRACRRFADVGAPLQFAWIDGRFTQKGLGKLEELAKWPHLACHVKQFTFLMPYFYRNSGEQFWSVLQSAGDSLVSFDVRSLQAKAREQQEIIDSQKDVRVLGQAIASFTSLQLVKLLRVADNEDLALLAYIARHDDFRRVVDLEWAPACSRGTGTIGTALLQANVPWSRFSSPMLSPRSAEFLALQRPDALPTLAARLTCLTLNFDDGVDLDQKIGGLSSLFRAVFTAATNMQAVHLGFPPNSPLSIRLEDVFHDVTWTKLVAFGVQSWKLDAEEIIEFALRHRDRLKGLRLRDVRLKDGSRWKDVLTTLRGSMRRLEWVSLRRIGYAQQFDEISQAAGIEVLDELPGSDSDSDTSESEHNPVIGSSSIHHGNSTSGSYAGDAEQSDSDSETDDGHEPEEANEMEFPPLDSPIASTSAPWCNCSGASHLASTEILDDDGYAVSNIKRKAWENWIVRRCPEHSLY